jgi:phosphate-selective porin OprO/OprP
LGSASVSEAVRRAVLAAVPLCALVASLAVPSVATAQSEEAENAPARGQFDPAPVPPVAFAVPELPDATVEKAQVRAKWFTLKFGLVLIADYNAFSQDEASLAQVGEQENQWDDRAARLMFRGTLGRATYLVAGEYKGFDTDPETTWQLTDASITFPLGGPETKLTVGKTKETFAYEMVGDAANLPPQERVLNPFFVSRNFGARLTRVFGRQHRMTASAGVYNDWLFDDEGFADSGTSVTARVTGLAWDADGGRYLHLGLSARYAGADGDTMRYKGRPESNVTDPYVDTGALPGDHAWHGGVEVLLGEGPFSVLGEFIHGQASSASAGRPAFSGGYVAASWVLTGESRPYDRTVGYARRVMPKGRWGAPEIVVRYSREDLNDGVVQGGRFDKTYLGVNWWATRRWKFGAGWGRTWLDRFGQTGVTDSLQTRMQFVY